MTRVNCVYIGFICDLSWGIPRETLDVPTPQPKVGEIIRLLDVRYPHFEDTFIDRVTLRQNPRRQIVVRPPEGRSTPTSALQGLETPVGEDYTVVFT